MDRALQAKLDHFFSSFKHQYFKKGEILIRADDEPTGLFYMKAGVIKQYAISSKGEEVIVNLFRPPSFFPMSWALNRSKNNFFYEAITSAEVWKVPSQEVIQFIKREPDIAYDLLSRVYSGLDAVLMRMVYLMSGSAYHRLISELILHVQRFGSKDITTQKYTCSISEKDLAAQTGMTRETVSREMKSLKQRKLIFYNKGILTVFDLQKLEKELLENVNVLT